MSSYKKRLFMVLLVALALYWQTGVALALPQEVTESKPEPPPKNKRILVLVLDGLQSSSVNATRTPNISGLGMAGIKVDRVSAMPPDKPEARIYTILSGTDPADHFFIEGRGTPKIGTILTSLEKRGIKTAVIDGTGRLEEVCQEVSYLKVGPFNEPGQVVTSTLEILRDKKPFFTVAVMPAPGQKQSAPNASTKDYNAMVTAADTQVGKLLKQLYTDGTFEETLLVVTGTTGKPPLVIKGSDFITGYKMTPVSLKDLTPTLGYLYGIELPQAKGLIMWNALRPTEDRSEKYMFIQRVKDLSEAYADAVDAAARLENEKILVQEEKSRLTRDKQFVEKEIEDREKEIERLKGFISILKIGGVAMVALFLLAMVIEYRLLKKRYLFFT